MNEYVYVFIHCMHMYKHMFLFFYARRKMGRIMEWHCPSVCPSTIACERDILKTTCRIDFVFWYGSNTTKTLDANDFGHSTSKLTSMLSFLKY